MNAAHWHLLLNHLPILGSVFGLLLLLWALTGSKAEEAKRSLTKASLGTFVVAALLAIPVYLTGEGAEEIVEEQPRVTEALIEPHEEVAVYALSAGLVLGALSLVGLGLYRRRTLPKWFIGLVLLLALGTSGLMGYTAYQGGQINHPEIRSGQVGTPDEGEPEGERFEDEEGE